ncbi:lipocalin family protein [Roseivirga sp.]|uniref:lipocalin family protein n=1 Tax=Roseivirga sp. TaxID=1964215 RepID=UPI003B8B4E2B
MKTLRSTLKIISLITTLSLLGGCSLVDLENPPAEPEVESPIGIPQTEAALMTALTNDDNREWRAVTFSLEGLGIQQCRRDDKLVFFNDGTYRYDGGETLCGGADDQRIKTGVWNIDFDNLQLVFDEGTSIQAIATVSGLSDNRIELLGQVDIFGQFLDIRGIYEFAE